MLYTLRRPEEIGAPGIAAWNLPLLAVGFNLIVRFDLGHDVLLAYATSR
jgi:hypothetical protein